MMNKNKWHKSVIPATNKVESIPVPILQDAAIAHVQIADGRLIAVLMIDTSNRPDIQDMISAHSQYGTGDVDSAWGKSDKNCLDLWLIFKRPSRCVLRFKFDISLQASIIDQIILSKALYIQDAKPGEKLSGTLENPRVLVEVPTQSFKKEWEKILRKTLVKDGKKKGLSRSDAKSYSESVIREWRKLGTLRMKQ